MKLEKKHWILLCVLVAVIIIWYFSKKKKPESNYRVGGSGNATPANRCVTCMQNCLDGGSSFEVCNYVCCSGNSSSSAKMKPQKTAKSQESNFTWPRWLKITRACPQGWILDPVTKGCIRPWQQQF